MTEIRVALIADPTLTAAWTHPMWDRHVAIAGLGVFCLDAVVVAGTIRLYYSDGGGVYYLQSSDGGVTWLAPVTVETRRRRHHLRPVRLLSPRWLGRALVCGLLELHRRRLSAAGGGCGDWAGKRL